MPKLRRLTIVSLDPERLARYYEQVFDMRRVANPKGEAIYLSDGYFNLTRHTEPCRRKAERPQPYRLRCRSERGREAARAIRALGIAQARLARRQAVLRRSARHRSRRKQHGHLDPRISDRVIPCRHIMMAGQSIDSQAPEWSGPRHDRLPYSQTVVFTVLKRDVGRLELRVLGFENGELLNGLRSWGLPGNLTLNA